MTVAGITTWRDVPVLESILRLDRAQESATPERIAEEAILHLGDVYDSIAHLVALEIVEVDEAPRERIADDEIIVSLASPLRALIRFGVMGGVSPSISTTLASDNSRSRSANAQV
jgi:hypothetical protein